MLLIKDKNKSKSYVSFYIVLLHYNKKFKNLRIRTQPWTKIKEIKTRLANELKLDANFIRLFYKNSEMIEKLSVLDYHMTNNKDNIINYYVNDDLNNNQSFNINVYGGFPNDKKLTKLITDIQMGFLNNIKPVANNSEGTSGIYLLKNNNRNTVAIFKPIDEEAFAPNNQKGYIGKFGQCSFRKGILSGEGSIREVVTSLLDREKHIFKVPESTFVEISHESFFNFKALDMMMDVDVESFNNIKYSVIHNFLIENVVSDDSKKINTIVSNNEVNYYNKKLSTPFIIKSKEINKYNKDYFYLEEQENILQCTSNNSNLNKFKKKYGSLQKYVNNSEVAANYPYEIFPVEEVHLIALLDFRILNCDRNDENILVIKKINLKGIKEIKLIPIDHCLSFPDCIEINEYEMCWMGWKQSKEKFSSKLKEYISNINIDNDLNKISNIVKIRPKCLQNFRISNVVLKICVLEYDLSPYQIGMIMYRPEFEESPSTIELICEKAHNLSKFYINIQSRLIEINETMSNDLSINENIYKNNYFCQANEYISIKNLNLLDYNNLLDDLKYTNYESDYYDTLNDEKYIQKLSINEYKDLLSTTSTAFDEVKSNYNSCNSVYKKSSNSNTINKFTKKTNKISNEKKVISKQSNLLKSNKKILKRTASEPNIILPEINSNNILHNNTNSTKDFTNRKNSHDEYYNKVFQDNKAKISNIYNIEKMFYKKNNKSNLELEKEDLINSPYNEIFFYKFEFLLREYLDEHYNKSTADSV